MTTFSKAHASNDSLTPAKTDNLTIRGTQVPIVHADVGQERLQFYTDNPRIYSMVRRDGKVPAQADIQRQLLAMEHVKELIQDIQRNGGLMEPLFVRRGSFQVLEGNSRLAAYRALAKKDPIRWAKVPCILLPDDIPESLTFALLAQLHLKGKKDWAPFEQAGYLYRRYYDQHIDLITLSAESSLSQQRVRQLIDTYAFMLKCGEVDITKWSYYEEFLRSRAIQKACERYPLFERTVVHLIQKDASVRAIDIRDKLPKICVAPVRTIKRFAEGRITFARAYENALDAGVDNNAYRKVNRFRQWLAEGDTAKALLNSDGEADKIAYELGKIRARVSQLEQMLTRQRSR